MGKAEEQDGRRFLRTGVETNIVLPVVEFLSMLFNREFELDATFLVLGMMSDVVVVKAMVSSEGHDNNER